MNKVVINKSCQTGDITLTLPLAKALKHLNEDTHISYICSPKDVGVVQHCPYVDEVIIYGNTKNVYKRTLQLIKSLRPLQIDTYIHLDGTLLPMLLAFLWRVQNRLGIIHDLIGGLLLNKGLEQARSLVLMHEFEYNLNLLSPLGFKYLEKDMDEFTTNLVALKDEKLTAAKTYLNNLLAKNNRNFQSFEKVLLIRPGTVDGMINWGSRNYGRLIERLLNTCPNKYLILVSYSQQDEHCLISLKEQTDKLGKNSDIYFVNSDELEQGLYLSLIGLVDLYVGGSAKEIHLIAALGKDHIGVYSPIKNQSVLRWGPVKNQGRRKLFVPDVVCGEDDTCAMGACPYFECMAKIEVNDILAKVRSILES